MGTVIRLSDRFCEKQRERVNSELRIDVSRRKEAQRVYWEWIASQCEDAVEEALSEEFQLTGGLAF